MRQVHWQSAVSKVHILKLPVKCAAPQERVSRRWHKAGRVKFMLAVPVIQKKSVYIDAMPSHVSRSVFEDTQSDNTAARRSRLIMATELEFIRKLRLMAGFE